MGWLKKFFKIKPAKKEDPLIGLEEFPSRNIQHLQQHVSQEEFNEGKKSNDRFDNLKM